MNKQRVSRGRWVEIISGTLKVRTWEVDLLLLHLLSINMMLLLRSLASVWSGSVAFRHHVPCCQQCSAAWSPLALLVSLSGRSWWWSADSDATGRGTPRGAVSSPLLQHRKDLSLLIEAWSAWQVMGLWGARRGEIGPCSAAASNLLALSMQADGLIHWPLAGRFVIAHF